MHLDWRPVALDDGPPISTSVTAAETQRLQELGKDADVLEIGSAFGYSAVAFGLVGARVTAVDAREWVPLDTFLGALDAYGVRAQVHAVAQSSQSALPMLVDEGRAFDLIFIDGDHTAPVVESDVIWSLKLLREGGTLAIHDFNEPCCCPDVGPTVFRLLGEPDEIVNTMAVYYRNKIVGEQRPEVFVPSVTGRIEPKVPTGFWGTVQPDEHP